MLLETDASSRRCRGPEATSAHVFRRNGDSRVSAAQAVGAASDPPPIVGLGAQLTFLAFLFIMLVVPWLMARAPTDQATESSPSRSFFTSARERHLWLWTVAVMVAIYATLSPAQELAAALRERNLLRLSTGSALFVLGVGLVLYWVRTRPGRLEIGAGLGVFAVYMTTLIRLPVPEARSHLFEYSLVAMLVYQALLERRSHGRAVPAPAFAAVVATALLGWVDEGIQGLLPNRVYDIVDVGFNALAGLMAVVATLFMAWARKLDLFRRLRRS